ncbi:maltose ABC transporter substrate-binding protein [Clostridium botulinum]|uniref:Bacterial extracellular solute-binding protein n=1 Tax=Clostridium botulinum (strain Eklund 17B / Type B) TaxID=935198 RepID=B2TM99_CLOBB|nr:putative bacterial extracellular solute-binding protein [Clostridium botulinum B str. Eklund 17B (NRP)]MBY6977024.1 maltose ABC transporter substrate-binding protein [Clostridium botulinum]MBY6999181.1 maltose ABC transporter substrate-binding protein [Clostridium botulinum]MCR1272737.1 maltose ABC transporter substrate-binding protein [Clostridium botulinum]NFD69894.1 maltose ABC transporter substrate-binding protein [Clostridium botulinum]
MIKQIKMIFLPVLIVTLMFSLISCRNREIPFDDDSELEETSELKPEKEAELVYWTDDLDFGQAIAKSFEEKYKVKVNVQKIGLDSMDKMMLDAPTGNGADVFMAANDNFSKGKDSGIFAKIRPSIKKEIEEVTNETALKTVTSDDELYGIPVSIESYAMLYNKDLVKEKPSETFEQIEEEANKYNDKNINKFWFLTIATDGYSAYPFLSVDGFRLFGENGNDGDNPGFNTKEFENGLEAISKLRKIIPIESEDLKLQASTFLEQNFRNGKTAYYPIGPNAIKELKKSGVNFGITKLPTYGGKPMRAFSVVQNAHVSAYTKYPNASQLFAQYLVSKDAASLLYRKAYKITSRKDTSNIEGLKDDEYMKVYAEQFNNTDPMPSTKRISYFWTIMESTLGSVFDGNITPNEAAEKIQKDFDALVQSE